MKYAAMVIILAMTTGCLSLDVDRTGSEVTACVSYDTGDVVGAAQALTDAAKAPFVGE